MREGENLICGETFLIIGAITSFNDCISPRAGSSYQSVDSTIFFNRFGKAVFLSGRGAYFNVKHIASSVKVMKKGQTIQRTFVNGGNRLTGVIRMNL